MKFKKLFLALVFAVGSLTSLTSEAWRGGRGGGWGLGGRRGGILFSAGVLGVGLGYGPWYDRPYDYYRSVDMCWADMEQLRNAYKRALDHIQDLEAQLGKN